MSEFVMPTVTKAAPRAGRSYPEAFVALVEGNYAAYKKDGRDDQESLFGEAEHAVAFGKLLKNYADNRPDGPISIRVRVDGTSVFWYAKDREVRVKKETGTEAVKPGTKTSTKK